MSLYTTDDGTEITTHSMLQSFSRCPKKAQYEYVDRLKPRMVSAKDKPLKRGTWFHKLLEEYYAGRSWKAAHQQLSTQFSELFDEEKEQLGDLPSEMVQLMRSYLWHYGANREDPYHGWDIIGTEIMLECEWPDGNGIYRCKIDAIAEDQYGYLIIDHKTHNYLPNHIYRLLDHASVRYLWCAQENGYDVNRFVWNYVKAKAPTKPQLVYQNTKNPRLSTRHIETDYPTFFRAVQEYQLEPRDYKAQLIGLKNQRWVEGRIQMSPFFRRDTLDKDIDMLTRVVASSMRTRDRMHTYEWDESTERIVDRTCDWCTFKELCTTELFGGNADLIRRKNFRQGDPLKYYYDQKGFE